ncbi:MAG: S-layer homology domain-containing protein [Candidatus Peribacteraceae bacterium]|nr:S-layer homology domain-containing protein [Candidatus Peribacteraceae bacterium]
MRHRLQYFIAAILLALPLRSYALPPVLLSTFRLHDHDAAIVRSLGYGTANILYISEMGTITQQQSDHFTKYRTIGCFPFNVLLNGKVIEDGFNCRSFFCVGFQKGPVQCKDGAGTAVGGVVEMNERLSLVTIHETRKSFSQYPASDRTPAMIRRMEELRSYRCEPFYLLRFDVAVGEGYECEEIGTYPSYSARFSCQQDWRTTDDPTCSIIMRDDELDIRKDIILSLTGTGAAATPTPTSSSSSSSTVSADSSSSFSRSLPSFPDVIQGQYGYTAIVDLASKGIINGYADRTFRPQRNVNRAEFTKLLVGTIRPKELKGEAECFPDVRSEWFSSYVCAAKRLGWLSGYSDGTFRSGQVMTKAEGIKIVVAALGLPLTSVSPLPAGVASDEWYSPYVRKAVELRILLEPAFDPGAKMSRADAAVWLYRSLKFISSQSSSSAPVSVD